MRLRVIRAIPIKLTLKLKSVEPLNSSSKGVINSENSLTGKLIKLIKIAKYFGFPYFTNVVWTTGAMSISEKQNNSKEEI